MTNSITALLRLAKQWRNWREQHRADAFAAQSQNLSRVLGLLTVCLLNYSQIVHAQDSIPLLASPAISSPGLPVLEPVNPSPVSDPLPFINAHAISVLIREDFANAFVTRDSNDDGPVRDRILGAEVIGVQSTRARTELDFVPCQSNARMFIHLRGSTTNHTANWTPQAMIRSEGCYQFQISKQVDLNGWQIATRSPAAFLESRQRNLAAFTPSDGIPVLGPLFSTVAYNVAEQQRPLAERIAAHRVTLQVAPQFNDTVDAELGELNQWLHSVHSGSMAGLLNASGSVRSETTGDQCRIGAGLPPATKRVQVVLATPAALKVCIHESMINQLVARLPLAGLEISDAQLDQALDRFRSDPNVVWQSQDATHEVRPPIFAQLQFANVQPIQVRLLPDIVEIEAHIGFQPLLGPAIPTQRIVMQYRPRLTGESVDIKGQLEDVTPLDPAGAAGLMDVATAILRQQVSQRLLPFQIRNQVPLPGVSRGPRALRLTQLQIQDGWMVLDYEPGSLISSSPESLNAPGIPAPNH